MVLYYSLKIIECYVSGNNSWNHEEVYYAK